MASQLCQLRRGVHAGHEAQARRPSAELKRGFSKAGLRPPARGGAQDTAPCCRRVEGSQEEEQVKTGTA